MYADDKFCIKKKNFIIIIILYAYIMYECPNYYVSRLF